MGSFHQILPHASNFQINNPIFTTGVTNVTYIGSHHAQDHAISLSNVLKCPAPSQYFVGREDTLNKLSRIFSEPTMTLWSTNTEVIQDFVTNHLKSRLNFKYPCVFLDASSAQALNEKLTNKIREQALPNKFLLVLENANESAVADYIPNLSNSPILVTSTQPDIRSLASFTACEFQLPDAVTQQKMKEVLSSIKKVLEGRQQVVTLVANGGTGKTQTVLQFVFNNISRFSNIWFFNAASNDTIAANFKELGSAAGIGKDVKAVRDFLGRRNENWLCIFDNADDKQVILKKYIPRCSHGNVIVTSRLKEILQIASPGCHIDLRDLDRDDAVELLLKHSGQRRSKENQDLAAQIVDAFGYHALAISTAGAYIAITPTCTVENYLTHFNKKKTKILNYQMKSLNAYQLTILDAFQLSFDKLSHSTQYLMQICAYLHPTDIPIEMFTRAAVFTGSDTSLVDLNPPTEAIHGLEDFLSLFVKEEAWDDSVVELCQLSLASYDEVNKSLSIHPIIHTCVQETVVNGGYMSQTAILLLGRATPFGGAIEDHRFRHQLLIQASSLQADNLPTVHIQICLAKIFFENGFWEKSEKMQQKVLAQCKEVLGEHHPDTLKSMSYLCSIYHKQGKLNAAQQLGEQVFAQCKNVLGEHHPDTLNSMSHLANTYYKQWKLDAAQQLGEESLAQHKEVLGEHHPGTLTIMSSLASTHHEQGKLDAAQQLGEEVLASYKEVLGEHHPYTLTSMTSLAHTYCKQGKLDAALCLREQVLAQSKEVLGEYHPDTLTSMGNLANTYYRQGKLDAAQQLDEQVLAQCKDLFGEHHPSTLISMSSLVKIYYDQGKLDAAQQLGEQVLTQRKELLGEHHPDTLISMSSLAQIYNKQGKLDTAKQLGEESLAQHKEVFGEHHPGTLISMSNLVKIYYDQGKLDAAQQLGEQVLTQRKELLGEHHPDTLMSMSNLANTYYKQGKLHAAQQLGEESLAQRKEVLGEHHSSMLSSMGNLANTYYKQRKLDAALQLHAKVLAQHKEVLGEQHPFTLTSISNFTGTYHKQRKLDAAQQLCEEALAQCKEVLGQQHPDTLRAMSYLASTYHNQGKLEEAQQLGEEVLEHHKEVLGAHHPDTLSSMRRLAHTYHKQGKRDAAKQLQQGIEVINLLQTDFSNKQLYGGSAHVHKPKAPSQNTDHVSTAQNAASDSRLKSFLSHQSKQFKFWKRSKPTPAP
ncbi:TPR-like protein [Gymnopus androsaceus JB14]|uniref:TPR-like protein n=1 Tax=Gymnopus androsaceus JB14 TaxID=1447944 RepID=A0A6A4IEZ6_9AGAR|nr:TPR-like protein [Gymnopus androsaceus JB14]